MKRANGCAQTPSGSKRASSQTNGKIFNSANAEWGERRTTLKSRQTEDEYTAAQASALNAHYTSPTVIRTIYQGLENLGFHRGSILEKTLLDTIQPAA